MRMLAYIRRSKESEENTVSIEHQRETVQQYCDKLGFHIIASIIDDGVSGGDRTRIERIKKAIKEGKLNGMVAYNMDRIARDTVAQLELLSWFGKRNLQMHTCNAGHIKIERADEFISVSVMSMLNEYQRRRSQEHGRATSVSLRNAGKRYSRFPPYGYSFIFPGRTMKENAKEQPNFQAIRIMTVDRHLSATVIARFLNKGLRFNRKGRCWSAGSIARIQKRILDSTAC